MASDQIESLVHTVLTGPTVDRGTALFELIKSVSDSTGDTQRYECAVKALRAIDPFTKEYESWFEARIAAVASQRVTA